MFKVTCIIPSTCTDKTIPYLKKCINSIHNSAKNYVKPTIFVITENQRADKISNLRIDEIIVVRENSGFARMNNKGITKAFRLDSPDYMLLINDDAWVDKDFFKIAIKLIGDFNSDILAPIVYKPGGREIDSYGIEYFNSGYPKNALSKDIETQLLAAACLLIKSSFLKKYKNIYGFFFNTMLYSYIEDVEFSIRAKMIGAKMKKSEKLIAYHVGSLTAGWKSYFVIYQSFRNIIWVTIMTWPLKIILRNIVRILVVQIWFVLFSFRKFGPRLYLRLTYETVQNFPQLISYRSKTISKYFKNIKFQVLFSKFSFRTYGGATIKIP